MPDHQALMTRPVWNLGQQPWKKPQPEPSPSRFASKTCAMCTEQWNFYWLTGLGLIYKAQQCSSKQEPRWQPEILISETGEYLQVCCHWRTDLSWKLLEAPTFSSWLSLQSDAIPEQTELCASEVGSGAGSAAQWSFCTESWLCRLSAFLL